ncbi:MAG: carbohydrate ABC transporter permease, partial [Caldilineaceae bacterium]|nr:carbohydrate ABC transporter permease [Caldilineaceae bacterium]
MTTLSASPTRMSTPARVGLHALLLFFSTIMLAPFAVMFVVSLLPNTAFLARDFSPANFSLNNYIRTFEAVPFGRYYLNSVVVSVSVTTVQILISSLAAFAFAR